MKYAWRHRLDSHAWHEPNLRNVFFGDAPIGRVNCEAYGPQKGTWKWTGRWGGLVNGVPLTNSGSADTMEEALEGLRNAAIELATEHPREMLWVINPHSSDWGKEYLAAMLDEENDD